METSNGNSTGSTKKDETEKIHEEMQLLKQQLKEKDAMITQLQQHILTLETEPLQNKKRRLENDDWELQVNDAKDEEIERLTKENDQLKQKPGSWSETDDEDSLVIPGNQQRDDQINQNDIQTRKIIKIIEEKISNGFETIQSNVEKLINDKLNDATCPDQPKPGTNESPVSYAAVLRKNGNETATVTDFRAIMVATKMKNWQKKLTENAE